MIRDALEPGRKAARRSRFEATKVADCLDQSLLQQVVNTTTLPRRRRQRRRDTTGKPLAVQYQQSFESRCGHRRRRSREVRRVRLPSNDSPVGKILEGDLFYHGHRFRCQGTPVREVKANCTPPMMLSGSLTETGRRFGRNFLLRRCPQGQCGDCALPCEAPVRRARASRLRAFGRSPRKIDDYESSPR